MKNYKINKDNLKTKSEDYNDKNKKWKNKNKKPLICYNKLNEIFKDLINILSNLMIALKINSKKINSLLLIKMDSEDKFFQN